MIIVPCSIQDAKEFVRQFHRHREPPLSGLFAAACAETSVCREVDITARAGEGRVCGVAIVGRPAARGLQDGWTAEITRVATDGTRNACSMLYAACWRAARALGYRRLITYTLKSESGVSLRAAGWVVVGETNGRSWSCPARPRIDKYPTQDKFRWERSA